jgi:hypothetical protein
VEQQGWVERGQWRVGGHRVDPRSVQDWEERPGASCLEEAEGGRIICACSVLPDARVLVHAGVNEELMEDALITAQIRTQFGALHFQLINNEVYAEPRGNDLYIHEYSALFANTLRSESGHRRRACTLRYNGSA